MPDGPRAFVKNWAEFQHYSKRRPPWIKLHHSLLDDYDFVRLQVAGKALAPLLWLIASESDDGSFPLDLDWLSFRLRMDEKDVETGLKGLESAGFITGASNVLASCYQGAMPEERRVERREEETRCAHGAFPYQEVMEILNTVCGRSYATDPVAKSHRDLIRARCKDGATVEDFRLVITEKHRQWGEGDKERTWLRPSTLFRASKWDDYLTEARERQSDEKVAENRREGDSRRSKEVEARMAWDAEVDMMGQDARPLAHFMREAGLEAAD